MNDKTDENLSTSLEVKKEIQMDLFTKIQREVFKDLKELDIKATRDHSNPINSVESLLAGISHMDNDSKHNIMVEWVKLIEQNGLDIPAKFASYASE